MSASSKNSPGGDGGGKSGLDSTLDDTVELLEMKTNDLAKLQSEDEQDGIGKQPFEAFASTASIKGAENKGLAGGRVLPRSSMAHKLYADGDFHGAREICEQIYQIAAHKTENLLLLGACHFQLRNFSECIFFNQQVRYLKVVHGSLFIVTNRDM